MSWWVVSSLGQVYLPAWFSVGLNVFCRGLEVSEGILVYRVWAPKYQLDSMEASPEGSGSPRGIIFYHMFFHSFQLYWALEGPRVEGGLDRHRSSPILGRNLQLKE